MPKKVQSIGILGGGFTGLSAAYTLLQKGYNVTIIEKESDLGGLAIGFQEKNWEWSLEKAYHHWFTNDEFVLNLARKINHRVIIKRPQTKVLVNDSLYSLDSPFALLKFTPLPLIDRIRTGLVLSFLKLTNNYHYLENIEALPWLRKVMGKKSTSLIWEPLFIGKFGEYKENISLGWFWARIKKRTPSLAYPEKGFKNFVEDLGKSVDKMGGKVLLNKTVESIENLDNEVLVKTTDKILKFDKLISTLPSPIFCKVTKNLPENFIQRVNSIPHLWAQNLILVFDKPFLKDTYWLNITQKDWPFLVVAEHTNFMESKFYDNKHIVYIGNYLPSDHKYLKMTKEQLLKEFEPYIKKLSPKSLENLSSSFLFTAPFAQPVVTKNYASLIPTIKSPLKDIYIANMDMVYPWDRGTNYAVELGINAANEVIKDL